MSRPGPPEDTTEATDQPRTTEARPRRPRRRVLLWGLILAIPFCLALGIGGLWLRLAAGPLVLPPSVTETIEARLGAAMAENRLSVGEIAIALPDGARPQLALRDIALTDPDGEGRAAFPALLVSLEPRALLRGDFRPSRIEIAGAGFGLSRDADGRIDFEFIQIEGATLSVTETLARIDTMFAMPEFAALDAVTGTGLNLAMADAMTGQVMRVRDAQMRLERKNDTLTLTLGGALEGSRDARLDIAISRNAALAQTDIGMTFTNVAARDLATASPALAWLDLMRAPISGRLAARLSDTGTIGDLSGALQIGAGQLSVEGVTAPLRFDRMQAVFDFDAETRRLRFDELALDAPEMRFAAEGHADVSEDGSVYTGQFQLRDIEAAPRDLFPAPVALDEAIIDLRLTLAPHLHVEIGQAVLIDGATRVHAEGDIRADPTGLRIAVDARLDEIAAERVLHYWPEAAIPNTRRWVAENVGQGRLSGVDFALRAGPDAPPRVALDFDFDEATVRAVRALPPIEGAAGYLSLDGARMVARVDRGRITPPGGAALVLDGSTIVIGDTRQRGPDARIDVAVGGALTDVLRLLAEPPVSLFAQGPLGPEAVGMGQADLTARLELPLVRGLTLADVAFEVAGTVREYRSETLVPGRTLEAEVLQVAVAPDGVVISGRAALDGVALNGQWARALGPDVAPGSRVEARAQLSREALAQFGAALPPWMMSGQGRADIALDLRPDAPPILTVASDLQGIVLSLPQLGWRLGPQRSGDLAARIRLGPDPAVEALSLSGAGLTLDGRVDLPGGAFGRLVADRFSLGTWLDVTGVLTGRGRGAAPAIEITGGILDLRNVPQGTGGGGAGAGAGGGPAPVTVRLDRLQVTDGIALTGLSATLNSGAGLSGQFQGRVNGNAPVNGSLITTEFGPAVRVRAADGGQVLRSAELIDNIHGGEMELIIGATGADGTYDGQLRMERPRLRDAPAMAELLNLISVVGLLEQLSGDGINLGQVEARFQITPSQVRLIRGSAVGPSMGLSMDGVYTTAVRQFDMQGVISPLYVVNGLFGAMFAPRNEGLFGFSYRLTGTPENTSVSVNPLSILTPGIFREIFRRPPPPPVETE